MDSAACTCPKRVTDGSYIADLASTSCPIHGDSAATVEHDIDCTCADGWEGMRCAMREDWFEGIDPTDRPPPTPMNRYQHDPDGMAAWARARRGSILPWIRRRAHRAIQYAIYHREVALGWRRGSMTEWVIR